MNSSQRSFFYFLDCLNPSEENKIYHRYYQWLSLVFILQAAILYIPAHLWKLYEGGLMQKICQDLDVTFKQNSWDKKKKLIVHYFNTIYVDKIHTSYVRYFIIFKMISSVFIMLNILILKQIIPGFWSYYFQSFMER